MCREIKILMISSGETDLCMAVSISAIKFSSHDRQLQSCAMTINIMAFITITLLLFLPSCLALLESVSLEKINPESPQSSEAGDMSPCHSPSTPRHLRYRQPGGTVCVCVCVRVRACVCVFLSLITRPQCLSWRL